MGCDICGNSVPEINKYEAWILAIINTIICPGAGTLISTCRSKGDISKDVLIVGVLQFVTTYIFIGYFWSIYWSYLLIRNSK